MTTRVDAFACKGGVDLSVPPWDTPGGALLLGYNHEVTTQGYRRIDGYERFDGSPAPSSYSDEVDQESARAAITAPPGIGAVVGVWVFDGYLYAFKEVGAGQPVYVYRTLLDGSSPGWQSIHNAPDWSPGGRFEFLNHNFYGSTSQERMYIVNGVDEACHHYSTVFNPISTGMVPDNPKHVAEHKNRLVLAFNYGSLQFSPLGDPHNSWTLSTGTAEIGTGAEITGLQRVAGDLLAIYCDTKILLLRGSTPEAYDSATADPYVLETHNNSIGAQPGTLQLLDQPYFYNHWGMTTLSATQNFGDFNAASFSDPVEPLLANLTQETLYSVTSRTKNQYRLMWPNTVAGTTSGIIYAKAGEKTLGFTTFEYPFAITSVCSAVVDGVERIFAGGADGYVYELDSGNTFDGTVIPAYLRFPFNTLSSPRYRKRFRKVTIEISSAKELEFKFKESFDYGEAEAPGMDTHTHLAAATGGYWNISTWGAFDWGSGIADQLEAKISGTGKNMSLYLYTPGANVPAYTLYGFSVQYDLRRLER